MGNIRIYIHQHFQVFFPGLHGRHAHNVVYGRSKFIFHGNDFQFPGFYLGEIKDIIYKGQKSFT